MKLTIVFLGHSALFCTGKKPQLKTSERGWRHAAAQGSVLADHAGSCGRLLCTISAQQEPVRKRHRNHQEPPWPHFFTLLG